MTVQLELWHLITLLVFFFGAVGGFGKVLLDQVEKRQVERAKAQDKASEEGHKVLREALEKHVAEERQTSQAVQTLERDFLNWKAELPVHYVRREDYVRGQSVIEAKLDALYSKLELVQLKGAQYA